MALRPLKNSSLRRLNIRPSLRDGLTSCLHISKYADCRSGRRIKFTRKSVESYANRLIRVGSFLGVIVPQEAEGGGGLEPADRGSQRFSLRIAEHKGSSPLLVRLVNAAQQQIWGKAHFHAIDLERRKSLTWQHIRIRQFDSGDDLAEFL